MFSRNELFWGENTQKLLASKHVAIFGLGGVGGFCAEMLTRAGVGELTLIDFDRISLSNLNRQIIALYSTIGADKTELFELRLKDINPSIKINLINDFYDERLNQTILNLKPDFIADAIDTMRSKISLLEFSYHNKIPIISSFGAGNRINPEDLYTCDIKDIQDKKLPFISNILYQLKKRDITEGIKVIASRETPFSLEKIKTLANITTQDGKEIEFLKITPASTPFVAPAAGILMASFIVKNFQIMTKNILNFNKIP
jgi:tRNA A37 threonylcarbamoyladenosine dehydratase